MFNRKGKGPQNYSQWIDALNEPLTFSHAEYLRCGTFRQKKLYAPLFNRISDYVTDNFNAAVRNLVADGDAVNALYELTVFSSMCKRLFFFRDLDFIAPHDSMALANSIKDAALTALKSFDEGNSELAFELSIIRNTVTQGAQ